MSGLYHALTDEHLPGGRLEARAEGNALGKGPVVFEVHQSAIEIIRKLASRKSHLSLCQNKNARWELKFAEEGFPYSVTRSITTQVEVSQIISACQVHSESQYCTSAYAHSCSL